MPAKEGWGLGTARAAAMVQRVALQETPADWREMVVVMYLQ
jgi:hypothetical protein